MDNKIEKYVAPEVCIVECQVEKGFATSNPIFEVEGDVESGSTRSTWWSE